MTKSVYTVEEALRLLDLGRSKKSIANELGISRAAVRDWASRQRDELVATRTEREHDPDDCLLLEAVPPAAYAYLLGLYLGDGCISGARRGVFKLRIVCCDAYPRLMVQCEDAVAAVMPRNKVGRVQRIGCTDVVSYSKHWPCLLPQAGPGPKHSRTIELTPWQRAIVECHPQPLLAGLFHSDGCRAINRVKTVRSTGTRTYEYPRYFFSNRSGDILRICGDALDLIGAEWRYNNWNSISVARRASVALLDEFIGPKT